MLLLEYNNYFDNDRFWDRIPLASSYTNSKILIRKIQRYVLQYIFDSMMQRFDPEEYIHCNSGLKDFELRHSKLIKSGVIDKSIIRIAFLILFPIIGNLIVAIYDVAYRIFLSYGEKSLLKKIENNKDAILEANATQRTTFEFVCRAMNTNPEILKLDRYDNLLTKDPTFLHLAMKRVGFHSPLLPPFSFNHLKANVGALFFNPDQKIPSIPFSDEGVQKFLDIPIDKRLAYNELPLDIIVQGIFKYLSDPETTRFAMTCKTLYEGPVKIGIRSRINAPYIDQVSQIITRIKAYCYAIHTNAQGYAGEITRLEALSSDARELELSRAKESIPDKVAMVIRGFENLIKSNFENPISPNITTYARIGGLSPHEVIKMKVLFLMCCLDNTFTLPWDGYIQERGHEKHPFITAGKVAKMCSFEAKIENIVENPIHN